MRSAGALLIVAIAFVAATNGFVLDAAPTWNLVPFALYYSPLDPNSMSFIKNQLEPAYLNGLGRYINPVLASYGSTKRQEDPNNPGQFIFTCENGEEECKAAMMQSCMGRRMLGDPRYALTIGCIERLGPTKMSSYDTCINAMGISQFTAKDIETCAESPEGNAGFARLGMITDHHTAAVVAKGGKPHFPTMDFNRGMDWSEELENEALVDLTGTLCKHFLQDVPECKNFL